MIRQKQSENQLPNEIKFAFQELNFLKFIKSAGINKCKGFSGTYLFQVVFTLIFHNKNWFRLLESKKGESYPGKDAVYRFLNHCGYAWRQFLLLLSAHTIGKVNLLTSQKRVKAFIIDDSMFDRNRSKSVELLARFWDHANDCYCKGFRMLTLGWSDSHTMIPIDFALLSSPKSQINPIREDIDKRTIGYQRRQEALKPATELIPEMIERALQAGITASYVLMDSWFTYAPLIQAISGKGLNVIGMLKKTNQRYLVNGRKLSLEQLYAVATPVVGHKGILRSVCTTMVPGIPVMIVFVRHRKHKNEWLAILSTDLSLTEEEVIRIYGIRWDIETFFKCAKSMLRLQKEFQGRSYDLLVSHTTIVFSRYILLAWQHRCSTDQRTFGGIFAQLCDEVGELDWAIALQQLMEIITAFISKSNKKITKMITCQLMLWYDALPNYIKVFMPNLSCES